ncbi:Hypothetical protein A7982_10902 [Minicystis rosea]|nr:Hypothetical protein A7982_10902 [Minicystis rosea]
MDPHKREGTMNRDAIEALLQEGLDLHDQGLILEAIRCWRHVLARMPGNFRAIAYLEQVGVAPVPPSSSRRSAQPSAPISG